MRLRSIRFRRGISEPERLRLTMEACRANRLNLQGKPGAVVWVGVDTLWQHFRRKFNA